MEVWLSRRIPTENRPEHSSGNTSRPELRRVGRPPQGRVQRLELACHLRLGAQAQIEHAKAMVIDGDATLMGSMSWTNAAARNSEDLNLVASRPVAEAYAAHWRERLAVSIPFASREDWCWVSSAEAPSDTR